MARLKLILVLAFLIILGVVAYRNSNPVSIDMLFYKFDMPATVLIAVTALLGFAVGTIFGTRIPRKLKVQTLPTSEPKKAAAKKQADAEAKAATKDDSV